jgi:hypothetical protein
VVRVRATELPGLPDIVIFERVLPLEPIDAFWCPGDLTGHPRNRHDPTPNTPEFA